MNTPFGTKGVDAQHRGMRSGDWRAIPLNPPSQAKGEEDLAPSFGKGKTSMGDV
jgi:hypothetical protein